jgi:hypothetical protein
MESLYIRSENGALVPMRFSSSQEILWKHVALRLNANEKLWFICLKGRQMYISTFWQALTFVRTLAKPGTHSLVIAQDLDTSGALFEMAKRFYDHLALPKLRPGRVKELDFPLPGGVSRYRVISAGTMAKGRGTTQTCVHASEVAYWPHPEILTGLFQAMPDLDDTVWVLESTANGMAGTGRMFYDEWNRAVRGESDLLPVFIPWFAMPKYRRKPEIEPDEWDAEERMLAETYGVDGEQMAWRRYAIKTKTQGSVELFHQEYPSSAEEAFIASGQPAFDSQHVLAQRPNICEPGWRGTILPGTMRLTPHSKGEIRIWKDPEAGRQYVIGADTAEGRVGGDYACAQIFDMKTLEQVAVIHGHVTPYDFSVTLNAVGRYYNTALICIEVYPQGYTVQDTLIRKFYYPNLHRWRGKPDKVRLDFGRLYGWETNVWSRPLLIEAGQRAINRGLVTLHEDGLLTELLHFSKNDNGKYEAEVGHDDRVIALLLALRSREENHIERAAVPNISAAMDDGLPRGLRIVEAREPNADAARRLSKLLRTKAKDAVKSWMQT